MKPRIAVTRETFPEIIEFLRGHFEVEDNQGDAPVDPAALRARLADKDGALVTGFDRIDAALLDTLPRIRAICNGAVGYNNIDVPACTARGIIVTNTPGVLDDTTADLGFALMLAAARRVAEADAYVRSGQWKGWRNDFFLGLDVHHATLGIVGMGRIGQAVARRARGFDMKVVYHNRNRVDAAIESGLGATWLALDDLLRQADFVVLTLPYSPASHHLIGARELSLMKPTGVLVNIARGGVVDEEALIAALKERRIAAAGIDVFEGEPNVKPAFFPLPNVVLVPHVGSASRATRVAMGMLAARNLVAALAGERPPSLLNPDVLARRRT
jgi:lactate dehydrogenase-like 2-hydroxyacid dehydrogenase